MGKRVATKKPETIIEKFRAIEAIGTEVETPHHVYCTFQNLHSIRIMGDQICFGEGDYVSLRQAKESIEYLVQQMGGNVKWY